MIKINPTPTYCQKFLKGEWNGHTFTVADYNGDIYVMFDDFVDINESDYAKLIQDISKEYKITHC
jgi:hypothetical protein